MMELALLNQPSLHIGTRINITGLLLPLGLQPAQIGLSSFTGVPSSVGCVAGQIDWPQQTESRSTGRRHVGREGVKPL